VRTNLKPLKEIFYPPQQIGYVSKNQRRLLRVADYTRQMLFKILALAVVWVLILIPIVVFFMRNFEGREITAGQAAVFIVQTLTTTGYGELLPFHSFAMVALSILLMVSGVFLIFMTAGTLMASLVENRIVPRAPISTKLNNHVVFTSFNETVARTINLLEHHSIPYVVAADEQPDAVELLREGIMAICADPKYDEGLRDLNIERAQLVVVSGSDTDNINITLGISTTYDTPILAVMENETRAELARTAGASYVVTLEETLGKQLVDWICADASPTRFLELLKVEVEPDILAQLKPSIIHVGSNSEYNKMTLSDAKIRTETGATVAAIWNEDGTITTPTASTTINNESTLIVLGPQNNVDQLATLMGGPGPGDHVIVIGAGKVGQEAGKRLNEAGIEPTVIDIRNRPLYFRGNLIIGDATKPDILEEVNIKKADTLIVTINDDGLNIFVVLASRQLKSELDVMARAVHVDAVDRLHQAGANHVLSESILGFQLLQIAMVELGVLPKVQDYVARQIKWLWNETTVQALTEKHQGAFKIICQVTDGIVKEPQLNSTLKRGDSIVLIGKPEAMEQLP